MSNTRNVIFKDKISEYMHISLVTKMYILITQPTSKLLNLSYKTRAVILSDVKVKCFSVSTYLAPHDHYIITVFACRSLVCTTLYLYRRLVNISSKHYFCYATSQFTKHTYYFSIHYTLLISLILTSILRITFGHSRLTKYTNIFINRSFILKITFELPSLCGNWLTYFIRRAKSMSFNLIHSTRVANILQAYSMTTININCFCYCTFPDKNDE